MENNELKDGKKSGNDKKKARKSLPKVRELKNTNSDVLGGNPNNMVSVAPCSGVFTGCNC